ncbi:hypothetical protein ACF0H5_009490 [Mactra antiquata]
MGCQDPTDITMLVLKIMGKCCGGGDVKYWFCLCRGLCGLVFDLAEAIILMTGILDVATEGFNTVSTALMITFFVLYGVGTLTLVFMWWGAQFESEDDDEKRKKFNRFFMVFKCTNLICATILAVLAGINWEKLDIENLFKQPIDGTKVFFVVGVGMDVLFDPIEVLIASCVMCRS